MTHSEPSASGFSATRRAGAYARACAASWPLLLAAVARGDGPATADGDAAAVLSLLGTRCAACHNGQKAEGGLNLESYAALLRGGDSGPAVAPGQAAASELVRRIRAVDDSAMPPTGNAAGAAPLTEAEVAAVEAWIQAGALAADQADPALSWQPLAEALRPMYALHATADGQCVVAGRGNRATAYRWPAVGGGAEAFPLIDPAVQRELPAAGPATHLDLVQSAAVSPDGRRIATGGYRDVKIWRRVSGLVEGGLASMLRGSRVVAATADGLRIARATPAPAVEIVRVDRARTTHRIDCETPVVGLAWSSDGTRLLVATDDGGVRLYATAPHEAGGVAAPPLAGVRQFDQPLQGLALHDSGAFTGVAPDGRLRCGSWEESSPDQAAAVAAWERWAGSARVVACRPYADATGPRLAILLADGALVLAAANGGAALHALSHGGPAVELLAAADGAQLVSIGADGSLKAWSGADGRLLWEQRVDYQTRRTIETAQAQAARQKSHVHRVEARLPELESARQGEIAARDALRTTRGQTAEELAKKEADYETRRQLAAEGEAALAAAQQAVVEATQRAAAAQQELEARRQQAAAAQQSAAETAAKLAAADQTLADSDAAVERAAAALADFHQRLAAEKQRLGAFEQQAEQSAAAPPSSPTTHAARSADGRSLATLQADGSLRLFEAGRGEPEAVFAGGFPRPAGLASIAEGRFVAVADDGRAAAWECGPRWELERTVGAAADSPFSDRVTALDWSADGSTLAVGSGAPSRFGELKLLRVADGAVVKDWGPVHSDAILVARFSPDGTQIATGSADRLVRLHRLEGEAPPRTLEGHGHHVLGLAWHDDGHWLASSSADQSLKLWDVETETNVRTLSGFGKEATALAFVGRSNRLLSASADRRVRLHDAASGELLRELSGPAEAVYCAAAAGASAVALAGGQDGALWIWQLDDGRLLHRIAP